MLVAMRARLVEKISSGLFLLLVRGQVILDDGKSKKQR
jgi:hypothetical protein